MIVAPIPFTTRPELVGSFGMVASTHWIASAVALATLEKGGNAFDAAVAGAFVLQVVEPHLNGPGGDVTMLLHASNEGMVHGLCGQGVVPKAATIESYQAMGIDLIADDSLLAAVVPGAFDAWMLLLRDYGSLGLEAVMAPAIAYAEDGHPLGAHTAETIANRSDFFRREWQTSATLWLPGDHLPKAGALFANLPLAATWRRLVTEATASSPHRTQQIEAARKIFAEGFIAQEIVSFVQRTAAADATGTRRHGCLAAEDLASWHASYEEPLSIDYLDTRVFKLGLWSQGAVLLQALAILKGFNLNAMDPNGPDFVHVVVESLKLAMADREAYYGDMPGQENLAAVLLSDDYAAARRAQIGPSASTKFRPGSVSGLEGQARLAEKLAARAATRASGSAEPTFGRLAESSGRGDTCHIDVADRFGNMVSATPSGGWLQSSPTIPELGFCLGSRAQMCWMEPGSPSALKPGKRPRCTLSPSLVFRDGKPWIACGTPGGDQQDQWQLIFLLRLLHHGMNLQEAIDGPQFFSAHAPLSFWPRGAQPNLIHVEPSIPPETISNLKALGHEIAIDPAWSIGRLCAVAREDGLLKGAATPRLMQAYAMGR